MPEFRERTRRAGTCTGRTVRPAHYLKVPDLWVSAGHLCVGRSGVDGGRPARIDSFRLAHASPWTAEQHGIVNQTDVLHPDHRPLEWVPYEFRYRFHCDDDACRGHDMGLHDWEAGQSWRKFRRSYPAHRLADVLRERWWTRTVTPDRATHFFVGNIAARPRTFMLLGVFNPTVAALTAPRQDALF